MLGAVKLAENCNDNICINNDKVEKTSKNAELLTNNASTKHSRSSTKI